MRQPLKEQWQPYERLVPFETVAVRIKFPQSILREDVRFILPSLTLAADGPIVGSLFLVTETYLCEVRLNQNAHDFDVALLNTIGNYRVEIGKTEVTREEPVSAGDASAEKRVIKISYDIASISLSHTIGLSTRLTFVGEGHNAWLQQIANAFPIELLIKSRSEGTVVNPLGGGASR